MLVAEPNTNTYLYPSIGAPVSVISRRNVDLISPPHNLRNRKFPPSSFLPRQAVQYHASATFLAAAPLHSIASTTAAVVCNITPAPSTTTMAAVWSFLKLAMVFTAGGLFWSSVMAVVTASYALGKDNARKFTSMAKSVFDNIWISLGMGLVAARATLLGQPFPGVDDNHVCSPSASSAKHRQCWKWRDAWRVLKQKLNETRQQAVEGVKAIKQQAKLYAAAVGPPGLIPLQYILDRMMPHLISFSLEEALRGSLASIELASVKKLDLSYFTAGKRPPKLEAARVYDLGPNAIAMDCDVAWASEAEATVQVYAAHGLARVPVSLKNAYFHGTVRILLTPLTQEAPGFGACLVSFPKMPIMGLDVIVAGGEVTKVVPRIRAELIATMERGITESMLWPKRIVCPSVGMTEQPILTQPELIALASTDPLLEAEEALGSRPMLRRKLDTMSDILHQDNAADEELLKYIVLLPMPSFEHDQHDAATTPVSTSSNVDTSSPSKTVHNGVVWEQLQNAHSQVKISMADNTWAQEWNLLQDKMRDQFLNIHLELAQVLKQKNQQGRFKRRRRKLLKKEATEKQKPILGVF